MGNKNKGKVIQMLSPENYIRKKARSLPIYECWLNTEWEDSQMVQVVMARKHTNGNITVCFYLVDLLCLGVKDTHYMFNITETNYREQIFNILQELKIELCDYTLIHNIIFAGIEFAEEYGFKPHKDFTSVTQFMLEEDTEDIELIEIECGENGNPVYVRGLFDNDATVNKILKQLEHTAGKGNFDFVDDTDDDDELDEDWEDEVFEDNLDFENKYDSLKISEKLILFKNQLQNLEKLNEKEKIDFGDLLESIINNYLNQEKADAIYDTYWEILENIEITDEIPDEMIASNQLSLIENPELKLQFSDLYNLMLDYSPKAKTELKSLLKSYPDNPAIRFLELSILRMESSRKYPTKVDEYARKYPHYPLIKLLVEIKNIVINDAFDNNLSIETILENFFPNRKSLHRIEIYHILLLLLTYSSRTKNLELTDALDLLLEEFNLLAREIEILGYFVTMGKFEFILSLLPDE